MRPFFVLALVLPLIALACGGSPSPPPPPGEPPPPQTPLEVAQRFLALWREGRYDDMYDLLSAESQASIARDKFVGRYQNIAEEATITGIDYEISSAVAEDATEVPYIVTIHTSFFGDIVQENSIPLVPEAEPTPAAAGEAEGKPSP